MTTENDVIDEYHRSLEERGAEITRLREALAEREGERDEARGDLAVYREANLTCGQSPTTLSLGMAPTRTQGCGLVMANVKDVFRCIDCAVPFHKECLRRHCQHEIEAVRATLAARDLELGRARLTVRDADRVADEVAVLVRRHVIDSRSPAADALLDYRSPPSSARADRMAALQQENARLRARGEALQAVVSAVQRWAKIQATWDEQETNDEALAAYQAAGEVLIASLAALDAGGACELTGRAEVEVLAAAWDAIRDLVHAAARHVGCRPCKTAMSRHAATIRLAQQAVAHLAATDAPTGPAAGSRKDA